MPITKKQRGTVWDKSKGKCWYCGQKLPEKGWHVDHLNPVFRVINTQTTAINMFGYTSETVQKLLDNGGMLNPENDTIENMVPSCAPCNLFKATFTIDQFRKEIELQVERARRSSVNFRTAERFGLIEAPPRPVIFWFESFNP